MPSRNALHEPEYGWRRCVHSATRLYHNIPCQERDLSLLDVAIRKFLEAISFLAILHSAKFLHEISMPPHAVEDEPLMEGCTGCNISEKGVIREGVGDRPIAEPIENGFPRFPRYLSPAAGEIGKRKMLGRFRFGALQGGRGGCQIVRPEASGRGPLSPVSG